MNGDGVEISGCQLHPHLAHGLQAPGCAASLEQGGLYAPVLSHCISLHPPKAAGDFPNGNSSRIGGLEGGAEHLYRTLGGSSSGEAGHLYKGRDVHRPGQDVSHLYRLYEDGRSVYRCLLPTDSVAVAACSPVAAAVVGGGSSCSADSIPSTDEKYFFR